MAERFYIPYTPEGDVAILEGAESHHLARVMRAKQGDRLILFDGTGVEYQAEIEEIGKRETTLRILERDTPDRELPFELTLGAPLPKGDRQRWLIEKLTELGCTRFTPLTTERSVARPNEKSIEKLRRYVIEATKQCRRTRLMEIAEPMSWADWIASPPDGSLQLIAHPVEKKGTGSSGAQLQRACPPFSVGDASTGKRGTDASGALSQSRYTSQTEKVDRHVEYSEPVPFSSCSRFITLGPEGGFTSDEVKTARAKGWKMIDLGPRILRLETAAVVLVTLACEGEFRVESSES
jgi:16S rRNA (uracil1498-N3)-methyltransferase